MTDVGEVGKLAADLMDAICDEYGEHGATVGTIAVIVELNTEEWTAVRYRCNDPRRWIQAGLFEQAKRGVRESENSDLRDLEDEDDD